MSLIFSNSEWCRENINRSRIELSIKEFLTRKKMAILRFSVVKIVRKVAAEKYDGNMRFEAEQFSYDILKTE